MEAQHSTHFTFSGRLTWEIMTWSFIDLSLKTWLDTTLTLLSINIQDEWNEKTKWSWRNVDRCSIRETKEWSNGTFIRRTAFIRTRMLGEKEAKKKSKLEFFYKLWLGISDLMKLRDEGMCRNNTWHRLRGGAAGVEDCHLSLGEIYVSRMSDRIGSTPSNKL